MTESEIITLLRAAPDIEARFCRIIASLLLSEDVYTIVVRYPDLLSEHGIDQVGKAVLPLLKSRELELAGRAMAETRILRHILLMGT
jgi:hypothetical protein